MDLDSDEAELDLVGVAERVGQIRGEPLAVEVGAVGAAHVVNEKMRVLLVDARMPARDAAVVAAVGG